MWPPTASTLIDGERDTILVDPLMTIDESRRRTSSAIPVIAISLNALSSSPGSTAPDVAGAFSAGGPAAVAGGEPVRGLDL
jgi:hypothetical protein